LFNGFGQESGVKDLEKGHFKRRKRSINHHDNDSQVRKRKKNMHFYDRMSSLLKQENSVSIISCLLQGNNEYTHQEKKINQNEMSMFGDKAADKMNIMLVLLAPLVVQSVSLLCCI